MKKVLILGAGVYQTPLIKKAKQMGLYTIVASIPGNYPGFKEADKILYIDTTNKEDILLAAQEERIDAICTTGTDVAIETLGYVCDQMGLCGLSYQAAQLASNKRLMKSAFEAHGVRTARFRTVKMDGSDLLENIANLRPPLIFKAVDTSGSRGIMIAAQPSEYELALKHASSATKLDYIIIEEFLEGSEFGAQALVHDGKIIFILPHGDYVYIGDTGVPIGHYAPYMITETMMLDVKSQLEKAVAALGLDNCAINADFIFYDNESYVLEIGARAGATCLVELVGIYYGTDYYEELIKNSLGEPIIWNIMDHPIPNASFLLYSDVAGIIESQDNFNSPDDDIVDVSFDYNIGDSIRKFKTGPDRIGQIITKGKTLKEAQQLLQKAVDHIEIAVKNDTGDRIIVETPITSSYLNEGGMN